MLYTPLFVPPAPNIGVAFIAEAVQFDTGGRAFSEVVVFASGDITFNNRHSSILLQARAGGRLALFWPVHGAYLDGLIVRVVRACAEPL